MSSIKLSERLTRIAQFVPRDARVVDIGTDHALIPVWLVQNSHSGCIIAADVSEGPLAAAKSNVEKYQCEAKINTRLSDGFSEIAVNEVDCAVISGMGGCLIVKILTEGLEVVQSLSCLVIQPQEDCAEVRIWLADNGWDIMDEDLIQERGLIYEIIKATKKQSSQDLLVGYTSMLLPFEVGPVLFATNHWLLPRHICNAIEARERVATDIKKAKEVDKRKLVEYEIKIIELKAALKLLGDG